MERKRERAKNMFMKSIIKNGMMACNNNSDIREKRSDSLERVPRWLLPWANVRGERKIPIINKIHGKRNFWCGRTFVQ